MFIEKQSINPTSRYYIMKILRNLHMRTCLSKCDFLFLCDFRDRGLRFFIRLAFLHCLILDGTNVPILALHSLIVIGILLFSYYRCRWIFHLSLWSEISEYNCEIIRPILQFLMQFSTYNYHMPVIYSGPVCNYNLFLHECVVKVVIVLYKHNTKSKFPL